MTERPVQDEPVVLEGEDEVPHKPAPPIEPYTPEPGPRPGDRRAFRTLRLAWLLILVFAAVIVVWAILR
jgi:hypothetical protein